MDQDKHIKIVLEMRKKFDFHNENAHSQNNFGFLSKTNVKQLEQFAAKFSVRLH